MAEEKPLITFNVIGKFTDGTEGTKLVKAERPLEIWLSPATHGFTVIYRIHPILPRRKDRRGLYD